MIKTYEILKDELSNYSNQKTKIQRLVKEGKLFPIAKGLYETDENVNPFYLADPIYSPSYISFETALSYYDLIPERTYAVTCATYKKKKKKEYITKFGRYLYQDVPSAAFSHHIKTYTDGAYTYLIATKEKAILDLLYSTKPISNMKEMREYLFENMRINEFEIDCLDKTAILELKPLYHSTNVNLFCNMMERGKLHE